MTRLLATLSALSLALGLFGCSSRPRVDTDALASRLTAAAHAVPGVTGGDARVRLAGPVSSVQILCEVTSSAESREELLAVLDAVVRAVLAETQDLQDAMIGFSASNGAETVTQGDLGAPAGLTTLSRLRDHFG